MGMFSSSQRLPDSNRSLRSYRKEITLANSRIMLYRATKATGRCALCYLACFAIVTGTVAILQKGWITSRIFFKGRSNASAKLKHTASVSVSSHRSYAGSVSGKIASSR